MKLAYLTAGATLALLATPAQAEWVASWTASPHAPLGTTGPFAAASYENVTVSQILRITEGGGKVRVRFSNRYGAVPLEIGAARVVRIDDQGREVAGTARTLTFGGEPGVVPIDGEAEPVAVVGERGRQLADGDFGTGRRKPHQDP